MRTGICLLWYLKIYRMRLITFHWDSFGVETPKTLLYFNLMLKSVYSGIIRTALPNMDREARQEYDVVIQAKDMGGHMGGLSGTTEVKITLTDVNDNPPKFPQSEYEL